LPLELTSKFDHIRINGKGKITPVADASTLVEIVWDLHEIIMKNKNTVPSFEGTEF
jgi:hypothetical protein